MSEELFKAWVETNFFEFLGISTACLGHADVGGMNGD